MRDSGKEVDDSLLPHLSPLGWKHINLTGDYIWRQSKKIEQDKFRLLRPFGNPWRTIFPFHEAMPSSLLGLFQISYSNKSIS